MNYPSDNWANCFRFPAFLSPTVHTLLSDRRYFLPDDPLTVHRIDDSLYFTLASNGFATTSTVTEIDVYQIKKWWLDKKMVEIDTYEAMPSVDIFIQKNSFKMYRSDELLLDTILTPNQLLKLDLTYWLTRTYPAYAK